MKKLYLILSILLAVVGCTKQTEPDYRNDSYGYVQFKLYKEASYGTRAVKPMLDYLAEACKVKVTLGYQGTTIAQSLTLHAAEGAAELGLRSDKLQLLTGCYEMVAFALYDTQDELLYTGTPAVATQFEVIPGGLTMQDITVEVTERGSVRFTLKKDIADFSGAPTRAVDRQYTFDEIKYVTLTVGKVLQSGSVTNPLKIEKLPAKFSVHFDEEDEFSDKEGYRTSTIACDSLVTLPAGKYRVVSYETYDSSKSLLENNNSPKLSEFTIEDNVTTDADVRVTLYQSDEYIKDYYALYEIWKSLNGESWYYVGENWARGANWEFNKDPDLWGDQPGVELHSNGRVAKIDISDFAFSGHLSPAIGQLTELIELYLGTHNDVNILTYDPTLDSNLSVAERSATRMERHGEYLKMVHPATQFSEPCARALAEKGISIDATSLYNTMTEREIIDTKSGKQTIKPMDTLHGTLCNGLKSIPAEIGKLQKLQYLFVANSAIETLPEEIGNLVSCTDLEIYNCPNLKTFPLQIARLPELVSLNIANNAQWSSEEIFAGFEALTNGASKEKLQILYARQNNLKELPESFRNMTKIGLLDLAHNKISKIYPLGKSVSPVQLYLDFNQLESLPTDSEGYFCGYADSENFSVKYNRLKKVPNIFSAKSNSSLASVDFSGNDIDGFEGEEDGTYRGLKVETFTLAQNPKLTKYPTALAKTNSIVAYIILRGCSIDEIPEGSFEYPNSVYMTSLDLSYNKLKKLPREMHSVNLPYLYGVELSFNCFEHFPFEPLDSFYLTVYGVRSQRNEKGERCLKEWPQGIFNHTGLRGLYLGSNDLRKVDDTISTLIYYLDISDNPNIIFDASDICYAWQAGVYFLIYDKSQTILNCDAMLE